MRGELDEHQAITVRDIVRGRDVWDLGAGDGHLSDWPLDNGAVEVVAVEPKAEKPYGEYATDYDKLFAKHGERLHVETTRFQDLYVSASCIDVALLSWPINTTSFGVPEALVRLCSGAKTVIYLGNNFNGSQCGTPSLFRHMLSRRVIGYSPSMRNNLIIVEDACLRPRSPIPEELAGLCTETITWRQ